MATTRAHLLVKGMVQGVFFRASTRDKAQSLGLKGWVRNLPDGNVEAEAEGPEEAVDQLIRWCRIGPPAARVDDVEVERQAPRGESGPFAVVR